MFHQKQPFQDSVKLCEKVCVTVVVGFVLFYPLSKTGHSLVRTVFASVTFSPLVCVSG